MDPCRPQCFRICYGSAKRPRPASAWRHQEIAQYSPTDRSRPWLAATRRRHHTRVSAVVQKTWGLFAIRTHLVNQQAIQMGSTSFAAGDRLSAVEKETYSYGRQASHGLAQRSQTERVSQVQKFLDSTRASTSASSVQASPTAVSTKLVDIQPKAKRGYTWSTLAGRSSFSYGQFVAQNPGTTSAEMRRIAAQKFFHASLPNESTSE